MSERSAVSTPSAHQGLVQALADLPDEITRAIAGRPPEALKRPGSDGAWGVVEHLCHLRDWEEIFVERARAIIMEDEPELPAYDDDLWPIERDYRGEEPARALDRFRERRRTLVALLEGLPDESWHRIGHHSLLGKITLLWIADHAREHGEEHLVQIREGLG